MSSQYIDLPVEGGGGGGSGTVTSIALTAPTFLSVSGSPITTSGILGLTLSGTALPTTSGGTGLNTLGSAGQVLTIVSGAPAWATPSVASGTVTSVSVVSANGFAGSVATATTTPAITLTTSITGLLKGNGTAISAATSGTDYAPATSGSSILYGSSGGFANVTVGTGLSFSAGTLSSSVTGTVSAVGTYDSQTVNANGAVISGSSIYFQSADASHPGMVDIDAQTWAGVKTFSSETIHSTAGAASTPSVTLTGAAYTAGTATTNKPLFLIEPTGATSTNWSTSGELCGVNGASGFTGNLLNLQSNGVRQLTIAAGGAFIYKMPQNNANMFCLEAYGSTSQFAWGLNGTNLYFAQGANVYDYYVSGWHSFGTSGAIPLYTWDFNITSTSTAPLTDIVRNSGTYNLPVVMSRNLSATANDYSGFIMSGASTASTAVDCELLAVHTVHTNGSETANFNLNLRNAGTIATQLAVSGAGAFTIGAASSTNQHTLNTATGTGSGTSTLGASNSPGASTPAGWIKITVNGGTQYIPYF